MQLGKILILLFIFFSSSNINGQKTISIKDLSYYCDTINNEATVISCSDSADIIEIDEFIQCDSVQYKVTRIGEMAFRQSTWLGKNFNLGRLKCVIMPNSIVSIGHSAFYSCDSLELVSMSLNTDSIDREAFTECHSLKELYIPTKVSYIDKRAFKNCDNLSLFYVSKENKVYKNIDGAILSKDGQILYFYPEGNKRKDYYLPHDVKSISNEINFGKKLKRIHINTDQKKIFLHNHFGGHFKCVID